MTLLGGPRSALRQSLRRRAADGAVVLGYHDVVTADATGLSVTADDLRRHITLLRALGLQLVGLDELVDSLEHARPVDRLACITFDDALVGLHHDALPVLCELGVPATVFVVADHLGVDPPWWPGARRTMTEAELADWIAAGNQVGSHTRHHTSLPGLDTDELHDEIAGARRRLRERLGVDVDTIAYPSGHHDPAVRQTARDAGFRAGFTFLNGRVTAEADRWMLPRLTMGVHMTPLRFRYHLLRAASSWPDHQLERVGGPLR